MACKAEKSALHWERRRENRYIERNLRRDGAGATSPGSALFPQTGRGSSALTYFFLAFQSSFDFVFFCLQSRLLTIANLIWKGCSLDLKWCCFSLKGDHGIRSCCVCVREWGLASSPQLPFDQRWFCLVLKGCWWLWMALSWMEPQKSHWAWLLPLLKDFLFSKLTDQPQGLEAGNRRRIYADFLEWNQT